MSTVLFQQPEAGSLEEEVHALSAKLDRVVEAVEALDRRREEVEELITDLMPAFNGALGKAMRRLDALEKSGALDAVRAAGQALEVAATNVDPADLTALSNQAGTGVRTLRALTAPDVLVLAERSLDTVREARKGRPKTFRQLFRAAREPRVRRGLGALMDILRVLGEGVRPSDATPAASTSGRFEPSRGSAAASWRRPGGPAGSGQASGPSPTGSALPSGPPTMAPTARPPSSAAARPASVAAACAVSAETRSLGGVLVQLDAEGFLVDRTAWTPAVAEALAREAGIDALTDEHRRVIEFCREDAGEGGAAPGMRRITSRLGVPARDLYRLFPGGPGILAARIAGLGKPKSCV